MYSRAQANTLQSLQLSHLKQHIQILLVAHSAAIHHNQYHQHHHHHQRHNHHQNQQNFMNKLKKAFAKKDFIQIEVLFLLHIFTFTSF